jgi:hypothetical protein
VAEGIKIPVSAIGELVTAIIGERPVEKTLQPEVIRIAAAERRLDQSLNIFGNLFFILQSSRKSCWFNFIPWLDVILSYNSL